MNATSTRGNRHICTKCSTRFYDMQKTPATCPKCACPVPAPKLITPRVRRSRSAPVSDGMAKSS